MITLIWLKGLLAERSGRLIGAACGVALTVAILAAVGAFIAASAGQMTARAIADVPVDWQVQLAPGADVPAVTAALGQATGYTAREQVGYADVTGLTATSSGTVQTTGAGKVLGISPAYRQRFPAELRLLVGAPDGVLVAQQTAANLHVVPGDTVTMTLPDGAQAGVRVAGVVDLPQADSLFQAVGAAPGTAPQAPPDNVLLLPAADWQRIFAPQAAARPDTVRTQLHVRLAHNLPADPGAAFVTVSAMAHNLEARVAGSVLVGDNLAARLDGARADALYARVLFLFLGLPGAVLAVLLTLAVAAAGSERRRREQALLRTRGAAIGLLLRLQSSEALLVGAVGLVLGAILAALATLLVGADAGPGGAGFGWTVAALLIGLLLAVAAVLYPAWAQARSLTVAAGRMALGKAGKPLWQRAYVDMILLLIAGIVFWQLASTGYQVVLAPEGMPQASVAYQSFLAPLCLWLGAGLLALRLSSGLLARQRGLVAAALRPLAHGLAGLVAASFGRQHGRIARGMVLVALAFAFATSTAVFNSTYNAQSRVDAELTNGADVAVTGSSTTPAGARLKELAALPGVAGVQPMQHRFAYVGNDLQDLFGIDPQHIGAATTMSNAYFAGGDAAATLAALAAQPDGVLVAAETVNDYQLRPGDTLKLRLLSARDNQYHSVPFHFLGVVREFPTAPRDSFLVANAGYVAQQTGSAAAEVVLLRADGDPAALAERARTVVNSLPAVKVTDLGSVQQVISSSLTAVDLHGLTTLELAFAVLLVGGASGLVLALGLAERRRNFAVLAVLGARREQLGAFLWGEGLLVLLGGAALGTLLGFAVAAMLVTILTGVFDPPPDGLTVPWPYLAALLLAAALSTALAVTAMERASQRSALETLREVAA